MLRKATLLTTLFVLACLHACAQDAPNPEATLQAFLSAFGSGDTKQAATFVKGVTLSASELEGISKLIMGDPASFTMSDMKTTLDGTNATVVGTVTVKSGKPETVETLITSARLVSVGGKWLIVPDAAKARLEGKPDVVNALAYMLTDAKILTQQRDSARAAVCLSNAKQLGLGVLMLTQDYDDKFKLKPETFRKSIFPYTKNKSIFTCPSDTPGAESYSFNGNLSGVTMAKVQAPAKTVMIYEGKNGKLNFRHDGKAAVTFADGHAKLLTAAEAKSLRWMP